MDYCLFWKLSIAVEKMSKSPLLDATGINAVSGPDYK